MIRDDAISVPRNVQFSRHYSVFEGRTMPEGKTEIRDFPANYLRIKSTIEGSGFIRWWRLWRVQVVCVITKLTLFSRTWLVTNFILAQFRHLSSWFYFSFVITCLYFWAAASSNALHVVVVFLQLHHYLALFCQIASLVIIVLPRLLHLILFCPNCFIT